MSNSWNGITNITYGGKPLTEADIRIILVQVAFENKDVEERQKIYDKRKRVIKKLLSEV